MCLDVEIIRKASFSQLHQTISLVVGIDQGQLCIQCQYRILCQSQYNSNRPPFHRQTIRETYKCALLHLFSKDCLFGNLTENIEIKDTSNFIFIILLFELLYIIPWHYFRAHLLPF